MTLFLADLSPSSLPYFQTAKMEEVFFAYGVSRELETEDGMVVLLPG